MDDIKVAGKKQNMAPMWKKLMKLVDLGEPTSFLDHVHLVCTQRECKPNDAIVEQYKEMFESRLSAGATENYQNGTNFTQKLLRCHTTWKVILKSGLKNNVNWQTRRLSNCTKFQVLAWIIIMSRRRNLWMTSKKAGKKQNMAPMWKIFMKKTLILMNPHHFFITS